MFYIRTKRRSQNRGGSDWHELGETEYYQDEEEQMFDADRYLDSSDTNDFRRSTSPINGKISAKGGGPRFEIDD